MTINKTKPQICVIVISFIFSVFLRQVLTMWPRLVSNSLPSLSLLSAGMIDVCYNTLLPFYIAVFKFRGVLFVISVGCSTRKCCLPKSC